MVVDVRSEKAVLDRLRCGHLLQLRILNPLCFYIQSLSSGGGLSESSLDIIGGAMAIDSLCATIPAGILAERNGLR
jgi:hypothetical protein